MLVWWQFGDITLRLLCFVIEWLCEYHQTTRCTSELLSGTNWSISFFSVMTIDHQTCMHCVHLDHNQCACRSNGSACTCYASTTCPQADSHLSYSLQSQKHSFSSFILQWGHLVIFMIYLFPLHLDLVTSIYSLLLSLLLSLYWK